MNHRPSKKHGIDLPATGMKKGTRSRTVIVRRKGPRRNRGGQENTVWQRFSNRCGFATRGAADIDLLTQGAAPGGQFSRPPPPPPARLTPAGLRKQIRITLLHDLAQRFGMTEEELDELGYG
jgi:hypothetical protein